MIEETPLHLFYNCIKTKILWDQLKDFISNKTLSFSSLTPQSVILGHIDLSDDYLLINHIFLFTNFISITPGTDLNIEHLKAIIDETKRIEEEISKHELKKKI